MTETTKVEGGVTIEQELEYFKEQLPSLLDKHEGKIVLIKNREIIGIYPSNQEALREGARLFGLGGFLAKPIQEQEQEVSIPALLLGILRADNQHSGQRSD